MSDEGAVAWLRQVIEGDKAAAVAATPGPWAFEGDDITDDDLYSVHDGEHGDLVGQTVAFTRDRQVENGEHMARQNPLNVIADCEAKLAILDFCALAAVIAAAEPSLLGPAHSKAAVLELVLRDLASGYRHREGYADHWEALAAKEGA